MIRMHWEGQERLECCWRGRLQLRDVFARCKHVGQGQACRSPGLSGQQTTQAVGQPSSLLTWAMSGRTSEGRVKPGVPTSTLCSANLPSPLGAEWLPRIWFCLFLAVAQFREKSQRNHILKTDEGVCAGSCSASVLEGGQINDIQPQNPNWNW